MQTNKIFDKFAKISPDSRKGLFAARR